MHPPQIESIPYRADSSELFAYFAPENWAIFLDSGFPYTKQGRYDIFSIKPTTTLLTYGAQTTIETSNQSLISLEDPFVLIQKYLPSTTENPLNLPFIGGALGYFSYDLSRRYIPINTQTAPKPSLPDMAIGIYESCVIVDHQEQCTYVLTPSPPFKDQAFWEDFKEFAKQPRCLKLAKSDFKLLSPFKANFSQQSYQSAFNKIQSYLSAGDCYQVNLTQCFSTQASGSPWQAYQRLRSKNPAPFAAFLNFPEVAILCCSPERFLHSQQGFIETKPIKGTIQRVDNPEHDQALRIALAESPKDRAENLMIVDLLRNDLGKSCQPGSITVPQFCQLESFNTVHHLVSTIQGQLTPPHTALSALQACFPGGSITGAPKLRAMQIIEELEPQRRGIYCGSIGYYSVDQQMDSNIVIRTAIWHDHHLYCAAGGGIITDSQWETEFAESLLKIAPLLNFFENLNNGN